MLTHDRDNNRTHEPIAGARDTAPTTSPNDRRVLPFSVAAVTTPTAATAGTSRAPGAALEARAAGLCPRYLDAARRDELAEHLREVLAPDRIEWAIATIDWALLMADGEIRTEIDDPGCGQRRRARDHAHFAELARAAGALRRLLELERPLIDTAGLDWAAFDAMLNRLTESSRKHVRVTRSTTGRGRPSKAWRDRLIAAAHSVYPPHGATKATDSHFEQTVERLLEYLGQEIADVHGTIVRALRRRPDPGFRIRLHPRVE